MDSCTYIQIEKFLVQYSFKSDFRYILVITEVVVMKAMVLLKPRLFGRILDDFWGGFLLMFNIGVGFIAHIGRYQLGAFDNFWAAHFLVGRMNPIEDLLFASFFWPIFLTITMGLSLASCLVIVIKKIIAHYKEKNLVMHINLNLGQNQHVFNTSKYNKSIFKSPILISMTFIMFSVFVFLVFLPMFDMDEEISKYKLRFYLTITITILFRYVIPIIVLCNNPDMRKFMLRTIKEYFT